MPVPATAGNWTFRDNLFDKVQFYQDPAYPLDFDHNGNWPLKPSELVGGAYGYTNQLQATATSSGATEVFLNNAPPYQGGAFGNYYFSTFTPLYQAGSRTAGDAGLTQYTTFANQNKDASNQPVNIGLHYVAATNSLPLDTDGDGVPDYVEAEHGTDLNNVMTDGSTNDAYNMAYDDVDLSGDGLTGMAKKHLALNPFATEYPLNFLRAATTGLASGIITIPLNIGTNVDESEPLQLFVDGSEANATVFKEGTNWLAAWDTTTITNGLHWLALKFCCEHETGSSFLRDFYGSPVFVNVSNVLTFSTFNGSFCDQLNIDATVNNNADTYTINVYDLATSNLLTTLAGAVTNGQIQTSWDLTDGNGNIISDGPVSCDFSLSDSSSSLPQAHAVKVYRKFLHNALNHTFAVAWGTDNYSSPMRNAVELGMSSVVDLLNGFFDPFADPDLTYNILPLGGSGNVNKPGGDISFTFSGAYSGSKDQLIQALRGSGNFLWVGHGKPTFIYPDLYDESIKLTAKEIGFALNNDPGMQVYVGTNLYAQYVRMPYKLVVLFACQAYSQEFADAFGIADFTQARTPLTGPPSTFVNPLTGTTAYGEYLGAGRSTYTVEQYANTNKIPQAYVGWPVNINAPNDKDEVDFEMGNQAQWVSLWQNGNTISFCMDWLASQEAARLTSSTRRDLMGGLPPDKMEGILKWELSGCKDLKITNRNP